MAILEQISSGGEGCEKHAIIAFIYVYVKNACQNSDQL